MVFSKKVIVFDLDGTLNQTEIYALKAYHHTLTDMKIDSYTDEQIMARFGATFEEDVQYFFKTPTQNIKNQYKNTLAKYWNQYIKEAKTYSFVKDVLSELRTNNILCICSNAPLKEIISTLKILDIDKYFAHVQGADNAKSKSESLAMIIQKYKPLQTIMVGDRFYDQQAAIQNGVLFVGCAYGYGKNDELKEANYIINDIRELIEVVKDI